MDAVTTPTADPAATTSLTVSVVICAYADRRWDDLVDAVAAAFDQSTSALEVIVVVDHNPALLERVRRELPAAFAVENRDQQGLSGARNTGVSLARGEVIAFLDDDAVPAPDWIESLRSGYEDPRVLGVGGAAEPDWLAGRPSAFPPEFDWVVGCTYLGMPESPSPVRNLIGANMSFRRKIFEQLPGFRSGIGRIGTRPLGCEETELCIRARRVWPEALFLYDPGARVSHRVPPERGSWRYFRSRCYAEGLSKAMVSALEGARDGLASERSYTFRTLPRGVVRGLADTVLRRDPAGAGRAFAIVAGLAVTTVGYLVGRLTSARRGPSAAAVTGGEVTQV